MGFIREWAQQAAGAPPENYEKNVFFPWASITHNVAGVGGNTEANYNSYKDFFNLDTIEEAVDEDGDGTIESGEERGTFNIASQLYLLREANGGNVYENVAAYNPDKLIARVESSIVEFRNAINSYEPDLYVQDAVTLARTQADRMLGADKIEAAITAFEARQRPAHLQAVSRTLSGLWEAGAILSTQTFGDLAILEDGYQRTQADFTARLLQAREDQRANMAAQILALAANSQERIVALRQIYVSVALDAMRTIMTAKQDQLDKDLEYLVSQKFWNVNLLQMALNANSAIYGAQMVPRAQTKGERLVATITGAAGMGVQAGTAMKSEGAGIGMAGLSVLAQTLLM